MSQPLLDKVYLDDVLVKFSVYDRYHATSAAWITLIMIYSGIIFNNHVFVTEAVRYRCADNNGTQNNASKVNLSNVHDTTAWCNNPELCTQWIYDNPKSFTAEFQLACQEWKRTLVGSAHNFGYMVGLLIIGPLSDKLGRKLLIIILGIVGGVCGFAKSFVTFYWLYVLLEFLEAAIGDPSSPLYMLAVEMVATNCRVKYTTAIKTGLSIGGIIFPLMYWLIPYWRTFIRILYAPAALFFIFVFCLLDESPRWLLSKGKSEAAVKIIEKAAKINKIEVKENLATLSCEEEATTNFRTVLVATLKSKTLLKSFFVCVTWWITSTFVSHGLSINSVFLKGNKFVNYALASVVEIPGNVIASELMDKFNRKSPLIFSFVACAILCACQPFIPDNLQWLRISTYMVGKLISTTFFTITYIFTSELFPTYTRNSMHALCSSVGRIGGLAAPQTPLLRVYWSGLSTVIFGVVSLIAGLVTFLVPNTGDKSLPDNVLQAEALSDT